jgi:protein O-GlcNAc transferase
LTADGKTQEANDYRWRGRIAGRFREASDPWTEELRQYCFDPSQLGVWGKIDFQAKYGDRGKALFLRAIEVAPENPIGFEAMGEWYLENGDLAAALKSFTQAVQLPRPSIGLFQNLGEAFRRMNEPTEALRALRLGLVAVPEASELYYELGVTFDQMERTDDAMAAYRKAIALSPNATAAHVNLAVDLLKQNRRTEAYENLQLALKAQPTLPKALAMLADLEMAAGRLEAAAEYVTPLYNYYPGMPRARRAKAQWHVMVGSAAAERGQSSDAEREYLEAVKIDPESIDAQGKLGILYGQTGRFEQALAQFESVRRMQPNDPRPAMFVGMAYAQLGRVAEARRVLAEGEQLAIKSGNAEVASRCREMLRGLPQ